MSRVPIAIVVLLCGEFAWGQLPATPAVHHSISLEAKIVGSGGGSDVTNKNNSFSGGPSTSINVLQNTVAMKHKNTLEINLRNFSQLPDKVTVDWYFFAASVNGGKVFTFDKGSKEMDLVAGEAQRFIVASKEAESITTRKQTTSTQDFGIYGTSSASVSKKKEEGTKLKGWLVRVLADGKVLQVRASDLKYEDMGRNNQLPPEGGEQEGAASGKKAK